MNSKELHRLTSILAAVAAVCLIAMLFISMGAETTIQRFEVAGDLKTFIKDMRDVAGALRVILFFDNIFILAYVGAFVGLWSIWSEKNQVFWNLALGAMVLTGFLDFMENHHVLTMIHSVELKLPLNLEELKERMQYSQLKFHISYFGLFFFGLVFPRENLLEKILAYGLIFVQAPLGILVYTHPSMVFDLGRYAFMLSGLVMIALVVFRRTPKK